MDKNEAIIRYAMENKRNMTEEIEHLPVNERVN